MRVHVAAHVRACVRTKRTHRNDHLAIENESLRQYRSIINYLKNHTGETGLALEGMLDRVAKDAQERLIYAAERVSVYVCAQVGR